MKKVKLLSLAAVTLLAATPAMIDNVNHNGGNEVVKADNSHVSNSVRVFLSKEKPYIDAEANETVKQINDAGVNDVTSNVGKVTCTDFINIYPVLPDGSPDYTHKLSDTDKLDPKREYDAVLAVGVEDIPTKNDLEYISYYQQDDPNKAPKITYDFGTDEIGDDPSSIPGYSGAALILPVYVGGNHNRKTPIPVAQPADHYNVKNSGNSKDDPIKLTIKVDPGLAENVHPGDNLDDVFDKYVHIYANDEEINKDTITGDPFECVEYENGEDKDEKTADIIKAGYHYRSADESSELRIERGLLLNDLEPGKFYQYTDPSGKVKVVQTDEDGYGGDPKEKDYDDGGMLLNFNIEFTPGKKYIDLDTTPVSKHDDQSGASTGDDDQSRPSKGDKDQSKPSTGGDNQPRISSDDGNQSGISTSDSNQSGTSFGEDKQLGTLTGDANKSGIISSDANKSAKRDGDKNNNQKLKTIKLIKNAYVYTKSGKIVRKNGKKVLLKKSKTLTISGKLTRTKIKGSYFYKIDKNQYIKVTNTITQQDKVSIKAIIKGKKNRKIRTYTSTGKRNKKVVYGKKTYRFDRVRTIKGKRFYRVANTNMWLPIRKIYFK